MATEEAKISSDVDYVFISGLNKEAKEKTISKLTNHGFSAGEHLQSYAQISTFLIQNSPKNLIYLMPAKVCRALPQMIL